MKLKDLLNNEKFLSKYGDYEIVGDSYTTVLQNDKSQLVFDVQKPKPKSVWCLGIREVYYDLHSDGQIHPRRYEGTESDEKRILTGSAFLTKEDAEKEVERRKVETLLLKYGGRRWSTKFTENHYLWYDVEESALEVATDYAYWVQGTIYFDSEEQVLQAIDDIGESRIKKALFGVD